MLTIKEINLLLKYLKTGYLNIFFVLLVPNLFAQKICFIQENQIKISDANGENIQVIISGNYHRTFISPNNDYIATTEADYQSRKAVLIDMANNEKRYLTKLTENNSVVLGWVGDSNNLLINVWNNSEWVNYLYFINSDTDLKYPTIIKNAGHYAFYNHSSDQLYFYDGDYFYTYSIDGIAKSKFALNEIFNNLGWSSDVTFALSDNSEQLIFTMMDDSEYQDWMDGEPPDVLFLYDFKFKQVNRILPKGLGLSCSNPNWCDANKNIIFEGYDYKSKKRNIYKYFLDTGEIKILVKNAHDLSLSKR